MSMLQRKAYLFGMPKSLSGLYYLNTCDYCAMWSLIDPEEAVYVHQGYASANTKPVHLTSGTISDIKLAILCSL